MILIILFQKSKGSLGIIGSAGSSAQMLFGSTGGQDLFQKITWGFVACFLGGSLLLAILKNRAIYQSSYLTKAAATEQASEAPVSSETTTTTAEQTTSSESAAPKV